MKNQQSYLITAGIVVVVGIASFYGGMQYQLRTQRNNFRGQFGNQMLGQNVQGRGGGFGGGQGRQGGMIGMRPVNGEIISQDDTSITVKMPDGSSKIVIISEQTAINKALAGAKTDLKTGEQIVAFGNQNSDGSMTAQNISIGGMMMGRFGRQGDATPSASPAQK